MEEVKNITQQLTFSKDQSADQSPVSDFQKEILRLKKDIQMLNDELADSQSETDKLSAVSTTFMYLPKLRFYSDSLFYLNHF